MSSKVRTTVTLGRNMPPAVYTRDKGSAATFGKGRQRPCDNKDRAAAAQRDKEDSEAWEQYYALLLRDYKKLASLWRHLRHEEQWLTPPDLRPSGTTVSNTRRLLLALERVEVALKGLGVEVVRE